MDCPPIGLSLADGFLTSEVCVQFERIVTTHAGPGDASDSGPVRIDTFYELHTRLHHRFDHHAASNQVIAGEPHPPWKSGTVALLMAVTAGELDGQS